MIPIIKNKLDVDCIQTEGEFEELKDEWNQLLCRSHSNSIFLTWEWLYTWWKYYHFNRKLFIVTVRDQEGALLGIAPLCISKIKSLKLFSAKVLNFLGTEDVCSEYLDFIVGNDGSKEIVLAIHDYIDSDSTLWDYVFLSDLSESSESLSVLDEILCSKKINHYLFQEAVCPYISLPENYETYCQSLSKNMRYNLKRRTKNLAKKFNATFSISNGSSNLEKTMEELFDLHKKRRDMIGRKGDFLRDNLLAFHKDIATTFKEKGYLRIYNMKINGEAISVLYGFSYNNRFSYYQAGMDPEFEKQSVGMVLMGNCIEDSIANNLEEFDFLRGTEPYKFKWTQTKRNTVGFAFPSRSLKGKSYLAARAFFNKIKVLKKRKRNEPIFSGM